MLFPLSIFRHLHEQAFCSEDQNFEELPIKYMHKMFTVLLWKFETVLTTVILAESSERLEI